MHFVCEDLLEIALCLPRVFGQVNDMPKTRSCSSLVHFKDSRITLKVLRIRTLTILCRLRCKSLGNALMHMHKTKFWIGDLGTFNGHVSKVCYMNSMFRLLKTLKK